MKPTATLSESIRKILQNRLPAGWQVSLSGSDLDTTLEITSPDGLTGDLPVASYPRVEPRTVQAMPTSEPFLVVADYLSRGVRDLLTERQLCYADRTGNVRLVLSKPGLYVLTPGADRNPWPETRRPTLRGAKAARIVNALCTTPLPVGVRDLAAMAGTDPGYVSRLLAMLDRQALVERVGRGRISQVHWRRLLERWASDAPLESRAEESTWLAARGLSALMEGLRHTDIPHLLTGSAAGYRLSPVAPPRLASVYVDEPEALAEELGLHRTDAGANVILLRPEDPDLYQLADVDQGSRYAPLPLVVADLLSGPGRSPAEAAALMDWMAAHEEVWRG